MVVATYKNKKKFVLVHSFQVNVPFLFLLKISESVWFSDAFMIDEKRKLA